ncbi:hypothetical protein VE02_06097 [Pseudogymnoascus sp. 03VT05]|nr:hypothetical protein VE02_06097 [Pseudogymnoascus sp. 03VT05]
MMFSRNVKPMGLSFLLSLAVFTSNTLARNCFLEPEYTYGSYTASSQAELDARIEGCTSIVGILTIGVNYTGSLSLPFVTSISQGITTEYDYTTGNITDSLTSIDAENLISIGYLSLTYSPKLAKISFPNLSNVTNGITLEGIGESASIDFSFLKVAPGDLRLSGYIGTINFPILAEVGGILHVANDNEHDVWNEKDYLNGYKRHYPQSSYPYLDASFPALQNASSLEIKGNISSFSFPKLLSTGSLKVDTSTPLSVNIAPLVTTDTLSLSGNITELSLSSLKDVSKIQIRSEEVLDCSPAIAAWEGAQHSTPDDKFKCAGQKVPREKTFPKAAIVTMSIVIPLVVIITLVLLYIQKRKKAIRRQNGVPPPEYDVALEALPKYSPREDGGSVNGPESVQGSESVASTHPSNQPKDAAMKFSYALAFLLPVAALANPLPDPIAEKNDYPKNLTPEDIIAIRESDTESVGLISRSTETCKIVNVGTTVDCRWNPWHVRWNGKGKFAYSLQSEQYNVRVQVHPK